MFTKLFISHYVNTYYCCIIFIYSTLFNTHRVYFTLYNTNLMYFTLFNINRTHATLPHNTNISHSRRLFCTLCNMTLSQTRRFHETGCFISLHLLSPDTSMGYSRFNGRLSTFPVDVKISAERIFLSLLTFSFINFPNFH